MSTCKGSQLDAKTNQIYFMESVLLFLILLDLFLMNPLVSLKFFSHMKEGEEGGFSINAILTPPPAINYLMLLHPLLK